MRTGPAATPLGFLTAIVVGTLARKGMSSEMTEALAGNGAAIRNVTDAAELLVLKDTARHVYDYAIHTEPKIRGSAGRHLLK